MQYDRILHAVCKFPKSKTAVDTRRQFQELRWLKNVACSSKHSTHLEDYRKAFRSQSTLGGNPLRYVAPEVFDKNTEANFEVDIWAVGVIFFVMLEGKFPFNDTLGTAKRDYTKCFGVFRKQSNIAQNLLHGLLRQDPRDRFSTDRILAHEYLQIGPNWVAGAFFVPRC